MITLLLPALTSTAVAGGTPSAIYTNCEVDPVKCNCEVDPVKCLKKTAGPAATRASSPRPSPCQPANPNYAYKQLIVRQAPPTRSSRLQGYTHVTVILKSKVLGNGRGVLSVKDTVLGKQLLKGFTVTNIFKRDGLIVVELCYPARPLP
ncbi:hypothetical protein DAETH_33030 (plasmid) [Deinococcus aetherius]|uniref:Uncharacterized protein n=1 Tax=Deinococcus aetherius TaxID=200252 RepID=A0ABN6RNA0_9DEIO|nr:hypothetical protein DAETH_33030 [Deinococcus aetherius]